MLAALLRLLLLLRQLFPQVPGIPFPVQLLGDQGPDAPGKDTDKHPAQHVAREVDAEIDARNAHQNRKADRDDPEAALAQEENRHHGVEGRGGVAGGEALVALQILPHGQPVLVKNAGLIHIGTGTRDPGLEDQIGDDGADGEAEAHGRAEAPGRAIDHQDQGQHDQKNAALAEKGDHFKKDREERAAQFIELVDSGGDGCIKA